VREAGVDFEGLVGIWSESYTSLRDIDTRIFQTLLSVTRRRPRDLTAVQTRPHFRTYDMKKKNFPGLFAALLGVAAAHSPFAATSADLSADQIAKLNGGDMIVLEKKMEGGPWPEITVITKVAAPLATITNLFRDYEAAPDYQPNIVATEVVDQPSANVVDVKYTSKMPVVGESSNTVRNTFTETADSTTVKWTLLESTTADVSDGSMVVESFEGGTLLKYTNYVQPKSKLAILARGAAVGEVKKTVRQIKAEAERRAAKS
jgi:hypothetical protein